MVKFSSNIIIIQKKKKKNWRWRRVQQVLQRVSDVVALFIVGLFYFYNHETMFDCFGQTYTCSSARKWLQKSTTVICALFFTEEPNGFHELIWFHTIDLLLKNSRQKSLHQFL